MSARNDFKFCQPPSLNWSVFFKNVCIAKDTATVLAGFTSRDGAGAGNDGAVGTGDFSWAIGCVEVGVGNA